MGAYSEAVRLKPVFPEAYIGRGKALMDYGHAEADKRAQRDFVAALHLNPLSPAARVSLGYNLQVLPLCKLNSWETGCLHFCHSVLSSTLRLLRLK